MPILDIIASDVGPVYVKLPGLGLEEDSLAA